MIGLALKPFSKYNARLVIDALMSVAPAVTSLDTPRRGVRKAVKTLRALSLGFLNREDLPRIAPGLANLYVESEYALMTAITIVGYNLETLVDAVEYQTFSDISLPARGSASKSHILWNTNINKAVTRHFQCAEILRRKAKQAPRYRKQGHDYCQDMLEMCCRIIMRPAFVLFARFLETALDWPSFERSGVPAHVKISPKFAEQTHGGVQ